MKVFFQLITCMLTGLISFAQDTLETRIILIGDAGQFINGRQPVLEAVKKTMPFDKKTSIIYLGDNLYKNGLPDDAFPNYNVIKMPLDSQAIMAQGSDATVYMIPGNHDWNNGAANGYEAILRQQNYLKSLNIKNFNYYPIGGCPGPVEINVSPNVVLVMYDSQWWVHPYDKPGIESDCPYKTEDEFLTQLEDILSRNYKKLVVLASHHPFRSYGIHGGYFKLKQYIFPFTDAKPNLYIPLPIIGTIYPITRGVFGTAEDLKHPLYQNLIRKVEGVVRGHPNVVFVSGHEHALELIRDSGYNFIVSGSASKSTRVSNGKNSLYHSPKNGFATLDISTRKNVTAAFYTVDPKSSDTDKITKTFDEGILDFSKIPEPEKDSVTEIVPVFKDSVTAQASQRYDSASGSRQFFIGKNYRKEWSTPVSFKVFNVAKEKGGLTIKSLGGGKQTKSLRLVDKKGKEWTLRSIDKDPEKALPENLRGTLANDIAQDLVSAGYPYGALIVPELSKAAGVLTSSPEFFYVPDDPALGYYRKAFANTICLLEDREPTLDGSDTKTTATVISERVEDNDHLIDQRSVLKARLLDMLIGDFDRHFDQWKWGVRDSGKGKTYYPVPRDRDQAFFNSDGLFINYASRFHLKHLQGFKKDIPDINWFNWIDRDFDRFFLNELDEKDWTSITDSFVNAVNDAVIQKAVSSLPGKIYNISGQTIIDKLKSRRDVLQKKVLTYYKFLSKVVSVPGSNKAEYFRIKKAGNGVQVIMYDENKRRDTTVVEYNRIFDPKATREIRLYGLNSADQFVIDPDVKSDIQLRIIGGKGKDSFDLRGQLKNNLYDYKQDSNGLINANHTKVNFSNDIVVNGYNVVEHNYNYYKFPQINFGYNSDDGPLVGLGFASRTYGFRKDPYATNQRFSGLYAPSKGAYQIRYNGVFNSVLAGKDILVNAALVNPTLNNFYGFGNYTEKINTLDFYRVRYNYLSADVLLRKRFNEILEISLGPTYYHYWNDYNDNKNRILSQPQAIGSDSSNIYATKDFLGAKLRMDVNYIDKELFPTRGVLWYTELSSVAGLNDKSKSLTKVTTDMQVYAPLVRPNKLVAVLKLGAGHIFSDKFDYFQALNLGSNNFLRGFRKNRYSGSSLVYSSAEVRIKLFNSASYILPGDFGLIGFYDIGKVWQNGQSSKQWHSSFGPGFYIVPFNLVMVSGTYGFSDEDRIFNFTIGAKFNLTF
ncbi:MAG: BamA/TamA family outer membrane protein [Ginsengibacter sp.]